MKIINWLNVYQGFIESWKEQHLFEFFCNIINGLLWLLSNVILPCWIRPLISSKNKNLTDPKLFNDILHTHTHTHGTKVFWCSLIWDSLFCSLNIHVCTYYRLQTVGLYSCSFGHLNNSNTETKTQTCLKSFWHAFLANLFSPLQFKWLP